MIVIVEPHRTHTHTHVVLLLANNLIIYLSLWSQKISRNLPHTHKRRDANSNAYDAHFTTHISHETEGCVFEVKYTTTKPTSISTFDFYSKRVCGWGWKLAQVLLLAKTCRVLKERLNASLSAYDHMTWDLLYLQS